MIELSVSDNDVTSGSIAVSWCVSHETLDLLAKENISDPQLVICVSPDGELYSSKKEYRKVVPLKDLMTYIEFRVPGKNRISALISYKNRKNAKNKYLSKNNGDYDSNILNYDGSDYSTTIHSMDQIDRELLLSTPIIVNVPQACFAPEPPAWEKLWVNHFFRDKPSDQCNYRRRRLFAYSVQPFIFIVLSLIKLLFLLGATLIGSRNWSLKYLLHPLTYDEFECAEVLKGGTIFIKTSSPDDLSNYSLWSFFKKACRLALMPIIWILIVVSVYLNVLHIILGTIGILAVIVLLIVFFVEGWAANTFFWCSEKLYNFFNGAQENQFWYLKQEEMDMIICDNRKKTTKITDLPSKKRTFSLKFSDLKSKICRPFSA